MTTGLPAPPAPAAAETHCQVVDALRKSSDLPHGAFRVVHLQHSTESLSQTSTFAHCWWGRSFSPAPAPPPPCSSGLGSSGSWWAWPRSWGRRTRHRRRFSSSSVCRSRRRTDVWAAGEEEENCRELQH